MKLFAPKYYSEFTCIADRCRHSCCVGWEIDIDADTMDKYASLCHPYGEAVRNSIDNTDTPHFRLGRGDRCPHLDEHGLCRIICEIGEDCLCDICREHPRFYNYNSRGCFVGLGLSCEEACRIILGSDSYCDFTVIGELTEEAETNDFDAIAEIEKLYTVLSDQTVTYAERLKNIASLYSLPFEFAAEARAELLSSLEYLDASHESLFINAPKASFAPDKNIICERVLAYFIFRHCSAASDEFEFRAALGFALFCENLFRALAAESEDIFDLARIISEELEYSEDNTESIKTEFIF